MEKTQQIGINFVQISQILSCPLTGEDLNYSNNTYDVKEFLFNIQNSGEYENEIVHGYFNESKTAFFPIIDDIIVLLPEASFHKIDTVETNHKTLEVKKFYENFGWNKSKNEEYNDEALYVDSRNISQKYHTTTTNRAATHLSSSGKYLLDVACGPIYQPDYQAFSKNFEKRICVDISMSALRLTKKHIGLANGIFIMGDITNLPLKSNLCDNVVSFHTIYHVPKENQKKAVEELIRVVKPGSDVLIAYNWAWHSWLMNFILFPKKVYNGLKRFYQMKLKSEEKRNQDLYFYAFPPNWFVKQFDNNSNTTLSFHCLQSLHKDFIRFYIHKWLFGTKILDGILRLEEKYDKWLGKNGAYPLIVIRKKKLTGIVTKSS